MWRIGVCMAMLVPMLVPMLVAAPALAQTLQYAGDDHGRGGRHSAHGRHGRTQRVHGVVEPSRAGPAPIGFWYRCDMPAGYYPYVPMCQSPWRIVPSAPPGPYR